MRPRRHDPDHGDHRTSPTVFHGGVGGLSQQGHQLVVLAGQGDDVLDTHRDRCLPIRSAGLGTAHQDDAPAPWQRTVDAAAGSGRVE